jgi:peptidoglycan/xylan/chitin deacetylase (PgdA/CDA1 family)
LTEQHGDTSVILADVHPVVPLPATHRPADWPVIGAHAGGGIDLGAHSTTHRSLPSLPAEEIQREVVTSRDLVFDATGIWPEFFAYPYGVSDSRTRTIVRNAGYRAAFSLGGGLSGPSGDRWSLKRVNVPSNISDAAFEAWAAGFHPRRHHR